MSKPADYQARQRALDPTGSFAVSAPAGSGKTGLLTQRLLALLLTCEHPEEVLAITFTRKAAGEMRERILQALQQAAQMPCPDDQHHALTWTLAAQVLERDRTLNWQLLQSPNRLRLQTIDGLCRALARQLPFESGLGSLPEPVEDARPLYRKAVRALYGLLETDHPLVADLSLILLELDNRYQAFEGLLLSLLANRDQWLGLALGSGNPAARAELEETLKTIINNKLRHVFDVLYEHRLALTDLARYAAANLQATDGDNPLCALAGLTQLPEPGPGASADTLRQWQACYLALTELLLTKTDDWRKQINVKLGFPTEAPGLSKAEAKDRKATLAGLIEALSGQPQALEVLSQLRQLPPPAYEEHHWRLLSALSRLLPRLVAELTLVFAQEGAADFIDTTQAALSALGRYDQPSELALRLDYQIRHILIDEFQDTSAPQRALLEQLTAGWMPGDGRTLFIVGDGMQSCYGFRNANVGIFLQARQRGIGELPLEPLNLTVNFRSQAGLVDWVNQQFRVAFPARDDIGLGAVAYLDSQAAKPALAGPAVRLTLIATEDQDTDGAALNRAEAAEVVARIRQLRADCPDQRIALLARNRPHLRDILRLLDGAGIRYQAAELDALADRMAVQDLVSLLRALLDPTDRISWLSVLRAPWCGLDNADLLALVQSPALPLADGYGALLLQLENPDALHGMSSAGQQLLARTRSVLQATLAQRGRKPLRDWLEGCWQALGGPDALLSANDLTNCQRLLELVEAHTEGAGLRDWQAFEEALARLYAAPDPLADPHLQVMTIHKSKGLEFEQVIIPGLHREPRADEQALLLWLEQLDDRGHSHTLLSPLSNFDDSPLYRFIQQQQKARNRAESVRLFYVGCTRAINQLHLFACGRRKDGELKAPPAASLLAAIWDGVADQALALSPNADQPGPQYNPLRGADLIRRLPVSWQFRRPDAEPLLAEFRGRPGEPTPDNPLNRPEPSNLFEADQRETGTLLHALIQRCTDSGQLPDAKLLDDWQAEALAGLRAACVAEPQAAWTQIRQALLTMAASQTGRWLLDNNHAQSATELALWSRDKSGELRQQILDRSFVDRGIRWVVDYKSSQPAPAEGLAQFLEDQRARYGAQLKAYAQLAVQLGPEPVKTALYFPLLDHLEPL